MTRSFGTAYRWVRQDGIDRGELVGTPSVENAELRAARRRIAELDAELVTVKRATELFSEGWCAQKHCSPSSRRWRVKVMAPSGCAGSCGWRPRGSSAGVRAARQLEDRNPQPVGAPSLRHCLGAYRILRLAVPVAVRSQSG